MKFFFVFKKKFMEIFEMYQMFENVFKTFEILSKMYERKCMKCINV